MRLNRYLPRLARRTWRELYPETKVEPRIPTTEELAADIFDPYMTQARREYARVFSELEVAITGDDGRDGLSLQLWLAENPSRLEILDPLDTLCLNTLNSLIGTRGQATVHIRDEDDNELPQEAIVSRGFEAVHSLYIQRGQELKHPLVPFVKAWQDRPIPTEADRQPMAILAQPVATMRARPVQGALPTELDTSAPVGRLSDMVQGELPGLEHVNSPVVPVLPPATAAIGTGHPRPRRLTLSSGTIEVNRPTVRNAEEKFESRLLPLFTRRSNEVSELIPQLYPHGLPEGDFDLALRVLLGEDAPMPAATVARLKDRWTNELSEWRSRRPDDLEVVYVRVDGVYVKAGLERETAAVLVVIAALNDRSKLSLSAEPGYRESVESWSETLRNIRSRGMNCPRLVVGDGHLGIWGELRNVYPEADEQRCWNHKLLNVLDRLPRRDQAQAKMTLERIPCAETGEESDRLRKLFSGGVKSVDMSLRRRRWIGTGRGWSRSMDIIRNTGGAFGRPTLWSVRSRH